MFISYLLLFTSFQAKIEIIQQHTNPKSHSRRMSKFSSHTAGKTDVNGMISQHEHKHIYTQL